MTRLMHFVLFSAWLVGAVTGGLTVQPEGMSERADVRVVSITDWAHLTVRAEQVVLTVGEGTPRWRAAAPLPPAVQHWLRDTGTAAPGPRQASLQRFSATPL